MSRRRRPARLDFRGWFAVAVIAVMAVPSTRADAVELVRAQLAGGGAAATSTDRPGRADQPGVTCAMLPAGIRQQESGGRYGVRGRPVASHGGDRALGAYQIMPRNLPGWSRAAVGRKVSEDEFMASPALQDRIARHRLGQLCRAHGVRGAAAAWFSGRWWLHRDTRDRGGGASSVKAYVDNVMALARRYG